MSWSRTDDDAPNHPKMVKAGGEACWLWEAGLCHCNKYHTGGVIEKALLHSLYVGYSPAKSKQLAKKLVEVGLWYEHEDRYVVHDYEDFNAVGDELEKVREAKAARQRRWRQKRLLGNGVDDADASTSVYAETSTETQVETLETSTAASTETRLRAPAPARAPSAIPSHPIPSQEDFVTPIGVTQSSRVRAEATPFVKSEWAQLLDVFEDVWEVERGYRPGLHNSHEELARKVLRWAQRQAERDGLPWQDVVTKATRAAAREDYCSTASHPFNVFAKSPGGYYGARLRPPKGMAPPSPSDAFRDDDPDEVWGPEKAHG